jgi:hypothetical protein
MTKQYYRNHKSEVSKAPEYEGREEHMAYMRDYHLSHKEERAAYNKAYRAIMKDKIFKHYGEQCICCGESEQAFLTIDHIDGKGTEQRANLKGGDGFYRWLIKNNFPEGFRTLCYNCNCGRRNGPCPHEK